ncbi:MULTISPECIES: type II toxin-antitoxin system HipA family toxin [unclassified Rathayibacter]|uniref:type II toxin-antitoxin system HipA family toxin n=1 Tax=unclassified Rathayibacter TaxID=2609250 RepID=UPI00104C23DD|nr:MULTISPECIES: type II toxin-antitoxin system HipA family toxin [unclassified Rathayibacter]TCL81770.1 serine/threonine-protein kinase HipA [Rathayibacter sp. PhB192]TCM26779.1 serine/threonine-protein kinase HipA [Rathayibacter sp. PhB179]
MTTSEHAYVWTWLPGAGVPVVAGVVEADGAATRFAYARSYLERPGAIALAPELPLTRGAQPPRDGLVIAGALRDGAPDGWGRGVIRYGLGLGEDDDLGEIDYLLRSGSDRFGALDFQESPTDYVSRSDSATLEELRRAAEALEAGVRLTPELEAALEHGTSIGGARPKATLISEDGRRILAKFASSTDRLFSYVRAEATMLALAARASIDVPTWEVVTAGGKDVLLLERFDRGPEGTRRHVVSGLTLAGESEMTARYVSYPSILDVLRQYGDAAAGEELFRRIAFNMAISNSDDHARNHAAFWDGASLRLTPAFDLTPGPRSGESASQAMAFGRRGERRSSLPLLVQQSGTYGLSTKQGRRITEDVVATVHDGWHDAVTEAGLSARDRDRLWGRQILNPALHFD